MADTLDFEPTEETPWREDTTVSKMLDDIVKFQDEYRTVKINEDKQRWTEIRRELLLEYFMSIMEEEDIGVQNEGETRQIMDEVDAEDDEQPETVVNAADADTMPSASGWSTLSLPPSLEEGPFMEDNGNSRKTQETKNLYNAYKHLRGIVKNEPCISQNNSTKINVGLLDVETFILKTHKILLSGLTEHPGKFSTNIRRSDDGIEFPHFQNENVAEAAIQKLVDLHNEALDAMEDIKDKKERVKYLFKCTSRFLSAFLWLHPFGDGNGRTARLLCGFMLLRSVFPLTLPIYNVYSSSNRNDYLQALRQAQPANHLQTILCDENEARRAAHIAWKQEPKLLCSLLIESNWRVWIEYKRRLEARRPGKTPEVAK